MQGNGANRHSLWLRLKAEMAADKKKAVVMLVLAGVTVVLVARVLINRSVPASAQASATAAETAAVEDSSLGIADGDAAEQAARLREYLGRINGDVQRDLFAVSFREFRKTKSESSAVAAVLGQIDVDELETLVGKLKLQSTVLGPRPTAIINGRMFTVGQKIKLSKTRVIYVKMLQIGPRSCVVGIGSVRWVLRIDGKNKTSRLKI